MKTTKQQKNFGTRRFAACVRRVWLLSISPRAARRAPVSKSVSQFHSSAGRIFHEGLTSVPLNMLDLTRCEIFRGKVPRAKLKTKTHLETRTRLRQPNL